MAANQVLAARGARHRKRSGDQQADASEPSSGTAIAVGALLDGVPESVVLGISLIGGRGIAFQPSATSFVLAQLGRDLYQQLRSHSIAVRRADTFEGLDETWARIAVRDSETLAHLTTALDALRNINPEKDPHA